MTVDKLIEELQATCDGHETVVFPDVEFPPGHIEVLEIELLTNDRVELIG